MSKLFLDANFLLEMIMGRPHQAKCRRLLSNATDEYVISAITVHIIWYVAEKYKLSRPKVATIIKQFEILPVTNQAVAVASKRYDGKDFEDCLQAASAEAGGCDAILTLDKRFVKDSGTKLPVRVIS